MKNKLDAAYSQSEVYLLGYEAKKWNQIKDMLIQMGLKSDYLRWEKFMLHNFTQKHAWR